MQEGLDARTDGQRRRETDTDRESTYSHDVHQLRLGGGCRAEIDTRPTGDGTTCGATSDITSITSSLARSPGERTRGHGRCGGEDRSEADNSDMELHVGYVNLSVSCVVVY